MPITDSPSQTSAPRRGLAARSLRWFGATILTLALITGVVLIALFSFEQSTLRPLAERAVTKFTGRAFSIEGDLDARIGRIISVSAGRVRLANADWGSSPDMLIAEEIELSVELLPLLNGILAIDNVVVKSGKILAEQNAQGLSNWAIVDSTQAESHKTTDQAATEVDFPVRLAHGDLSKIDITVKSPGLTRTLNILLDSVVQDAKLGDDLSLLVNARIDNRPVKLQGHLGTLKHLLAGRDVKFDVKGDFDGLSLNANGRLDNVIAPTQATLHIAAEAADVKQVMSMFALPDVASGALVLNAHLVPDGGAHKLDVVGNVGAVKLNANARLQSLSSIDGSVIKLSAEGPDLAPIAKLSGLQGLDGLPSAPFRITSNLALSGQQLKIGETRIDAGVNHLVVKGTMSQYPKLAGTNLNLQLHGKNYLEFSGLLGLADKSGLQPQPYNLEGALVYNESNHQTVSAKLTLGNIGGSLDGVITEYPQFNNSHVKYHIEGKNGADILRLLKLPLLIEDAFNLKGEVKGSPAGFNIDKTRLTFGDSQLDIDGLIGRDPLRRDTRLSLRYRGPDLGRIAGIAGYDGFVPAGVVTASADAKAQPDGVHLDSLDVQLDRSQLKASGRIGIQADQVDSNLKVSISGADLTGLLPAELLAYVEARQAFELSSTVTSNRKQLAFESLDAKLGEVRLLASGTVAMASPNRGKAQMQVDLRGPRLEAIIPPRLFSYPVPQVKFSAVGGVGFDQSGISLDSMKTVLGANRMQLSGIIPFESKADGLDLVIAAKGPNLGELVKIESEHFNIDNLAFDIGGKVQLAKGVLSVRELDFATARGKITGSLGTALDNPRDFGQFDLKASGDDLESFVPPMPAYKPAAVAFDLNARGTWDRKKLNIKKGILKLDDSRIEAQGEIDLSADGADARLELSAEGKSFASLGQIKDLVLPAEAFQITASLHGNNGALEIPKLNAIVGDSDLHGSVKIHFADKPDLTIKLNSKVLDLGKFLPTEDDPVKVANAPSSTRNDGRIIPQLAVPVERLNALNLVANIDIATLQWSKYTLHNVDVDATLQEGDFIVKRIKASATEGELLGHFRMKANGDSITTSGTLEGINVAFRKPAAGLQGESFPDQSYQIEFATAGSTLRELAANLNGYAQVTGAEGRLQNSFTLGMFGGFLDELISTVNPFVVKERYTTISCFAAYTEIVDGIATINPGAVMQTDKLDMFALGQVDLKTERINLRFNTAARQGLGISVGDFINPFVGVGGTLAKPRLGLDPKSAMFEGGIAFATGGISILLKGAYGRWFSNKNPCAEFKKLADEHRESRTTD